MTGLCRRLITVLALAGTLVLAACGYGDDIAAVKKAETLPGKNNEALVNDLAGAHGSVDWTGSKPDRFKDTDIVLVTATIKQIGRSGKEHHLVFDFVSNRQTEKVGIDRVLVDGEEQNLLTLPFNLIKLQLD
ncbi:hypothetical protein ACFPL7_19585 [Dongia soli]|uniref:Lipoprotein n=1 Tax=Dongia soli TaxID=600628 RepID=A0ABU5E654_9PROT|nr:hypothetical protein [Dongia soli]MDY0881792.1 hypothetical protein [Dongia soli]